MSDLRAQWMDWSSRNTESTSNYFSGLTDSLNSTANDFYNKLPFTNQDEQAEPSWFQLSRIERMIGFGACLLGSIACFTISIFLFPVLALNPRKFGLLWSLGSLLFVVSFGILQGPIAYYSHLTSKERLPFTVFFFLSVFSTIYFSAFMKSTILTLISSVFEIIAVIYYTVSYFPFGAQTLRLATSVGVRQVSGLVI